jgi:Ca2+-binding RTX toxin-like protein
MNLEYHSERLMTRRLRMQTSVASFMVGLMLAGMLGSAPSLEAALEDGGLGSDVLFGADDDNLNDTVIQPPGTVANQSLNNTDVLLGGLGNDVLIGLLGNDVLRGGPGHDILVGGTEQGTQPNSDIIFGEGGNDTNIWAPGDGSDAFIGGNGLDALVFGVIDRDANNIPTLTPKPGSYYPQGVPTADVTNLPGFCRVDPVPDAAFGYDWLVRFFVRSTGALAVTIRVKDVEQAFCASEPGGQITYADLTQANPQFQVITLQDVQTLNPNVALIIR